MYLQWLGVVVLMVGGVALGLWGLYLLDKWARL